MVFILTSPPQEQKNFCVALLVREFLLAWAIVLLLAVSAIGFYIGRYYKSVLNVNKEAGHNVINLGMY